MLELVAFFSLATMTFASIKDFRFMDHGMWQRLNLDDFRFLVPAFSLVFIAASSGIAVLCWLAIATAIACMTALWLDALLFRFFSLEIELRFAGDAFRAVKDGFATEVGLKDKLRSERLFALLPLPFAFAFTGLGLDDEVARWGAVVPLGIYLLTATAQRARLYNEPFAALLIESLVGQISLAELRDSFRTRRARPRRKRSYLRSFFGGTPLADDPQWTPRPEHVALVETGPTGPSPSPRFGDLRGARIVMITLESIGRDYLAHYVPGMARTPFLDSLFTRSVVAHSHACVVPNTTKSHLVMYGANYPNAADGSYLAALRAAGYRTLYMTTANAAHWGLRETLGSLGVEQIIDKADFSASADREFAVCDYALIDQVPTLFARCDLPEGMPWLLHIQTANTHVGYRLVARERFSHFRGEDARSRFLNCIEEADWILSQLFASMKSAGMLENTLVLITADHGESFGEFGYRGHSNSVVNEQILVPFLMHHPQLAPTAIGRSSHLDVLPTLLDLLGIHHNCRGYGRSMFTEANADPLVVFSETVRRTVPTCTGLLHDDFKLMHDLVFDVTYELEPDDRIRCVLTGEERKYYEGLFRELLTARGVLRRTGKPDQRT